MSEDELKRMVAVLKVLADESRLRMVGILASRPCTGGELAQLLGLRAATVSHHLARLKEVGLVSVRAEGTSRIYSLDSEALSTLQDEVLDPGHVAEIVPEAAPGAFESKVLQAFFDGEKLVRIPSSRKKRRVVLQWLAERFPVGVPLSEAEVNERLQRHHWDSATLRRELVGGGFMTREAGTYLRTSDQHFRSTDQQC